MSYSKKAALFGTPVIFIISAVATEGNLQILMLVSTLWMLIWWISAVVPLGVTALLPLVLFPILGISDFRSTAINYTNPVIFLFLGGFILALALEKWRLHERIALNILLKSGNRLGRVIFGSMLATALLSMWISNTATTVMMLPIGISIIAFIKGKIKDENTGRNFGVALLLGIAYAANIGGTATLIGTPPNLVLNSFYEAETGTQIGFANWLFFALPLTSLLFASVWILQRHVLFPLGVKKITGISNEIKTTLNKLGKASSGEKRVLYIFLTTALLWIFRGQLNHIPFLSQLSDPMIAIAASICLFAFPSGENQKSILVWADTYRLPWDIILLFGGGIALANGLKETEIVLLVQDFIEQINPSSLLLVMLIVCFFAVFLTEIMSNVALVSVFVPIIFAIALGFGNPLLSLAVPLTLGSSCAFMFPIATPPNAIVYSSGQIQMKHMIKAGFWLNLICIILIVLYTYLFDGMLIQ